MRAFRGGRVARLAILATLATVASLANLARLARLDLAESELDEYAQQLEIILESVAKVGEVSTKDVKPMSHATGLVNIFREDITKESGIAESCSRKCR